MVADQSTAFLRLSDLQKQFGVHHVVRDFGLDVRQGEFVSFLGPSGCGKTTTLRMIAGFEMPTGGTIHISGRDITRLRPNQRDVGMVFQSYALFPNMTVAGNIAFGLEVAKRPRDEIRRRVDEMLRLIKLPQLANRFPHQLSGGQQQRVALARALSIKPKVLLLDEPLSALDAKIRLSLREEIRALQRALGITTIYVTHDQEEALSMSDRIVVMNDGRIEQVGAPFEIYNFPRTSFVASFVGTLNVLRGTVIDPQAGRVAVDGQEIVASRAIAGARAGDLRSFALRPEVVAMGAEGSERNRMQGVIETVTFLGSVVRVRVRFRDNTLLLDTFNHPSVAPPTPGQATTVRFAPENVLVLEGDEVR